MKATDIMRARGSVAPRFVNLATGEELPFARRHNTLTYSAAGAMAAAFGGDARAIPNRIGIVYGLVNASVLPIDRSVDWTALEEFCRRSGQVDVQVRPFSYSPSLGSESRGTPSGSSSSSGESSDANRPVVTAESATLDPELDPDAESSSSGSAEQVYSNSQGSGDQVYSNNAVTFHMHSDSSTPGAFGTCGSSSSVFDTGTYIYQAVLLNKTGDDMRVLAMVSLRRGSDAYSKPDGFEIALDWTVKFF